MEFSFYPIKIFETELRHTMLFIVCGRLTKGTLVKKSPCTME